MSSGSHCPVYCSLDLEFAQLQSEPVLLQGLWYALLSKPSPVFGMLDFYVLDPLSKLTERKWSVTDLTLRNQMGSGNYGQASMLLCYCVVLLGCLACDNRGTGLVGGKLYSCC